MYNYRILSFIVFTSAFWGFEVTFAGFGWIVLRTIFSKPTAKTESVKDEETDRTATGIKPEGNESDGPDLSDTPRSFPTYGRQPPLRYEPKIKDEVVSEEVVIGETSIQPLAVEADDEDEEFEGEYRDIRGTRTDSGIGTSFSEAGERAGVARRRSKGGSGKGRGKDSIG
jgi:seipin